MATQIIPEVEPEETTEVVETPTVDVQSQPQVTPTEAPLQTPEVVQAPVETALANYVHEPGTSHVNAFVSAWEEAKKEVIVAESKLREAEAALKTKLGLK